MNERFEGIRLTLAGIFIMAAFALFAFAAWYSGSIALGGEKISWILIGLAVYCSAIAVFFAWFAWSFLTHR